MVLETNSPRRRVAAAAHAALPPLAPPTACLFISSFCIHRVLGGGFTLADVLGAAV